MLLLSRATCKPTSPEPTFFVSACHPVRVDKVATPFNLQRTDLPDQVRVSGLQAGSYTFQLSVTDSNQQSDTNNVNVLVLSPQLSSSECSWEMESSGLCCHWGPVSIHLASS